MWTQQAAIEVMSIYHTKGWQQNYCELSCVLCPKRLKTSQQLPPRPPESSKVLNSLWVTNWLPNGSPQKIWVWLTNLNWAHLYDGRSSPIEPGFNGCYWLYLNTDVSCLWCSNLQQTQIIQNPPKACYATGRVLFYRLVSAESAAYFVLRGRNTHLPLL